MWPRSRICFGNIKFDVWLLNHQNIKLHSYSISRTVQAMYQLDLRMKRMHGDNKQNVEHVWNYLTIWSLNIETFTSFPSVLAMCFK